LAASGRAAVRGWGGGRPHAMSANSSRRGAHDSRRPERTSRCSTGRAATPGRRRDGAAHKAAKQARSAAGPACRPLAVSRRTRTTAPAPADRRHPVRREPASRPRILIWPTSHLLGNATAARRCSARFFLGRATAGWRCTARFFLGSATAAWRCAARFLLGKGHGWPGDVPVTRQNPRAPGHAAVASPVRREPACRPRILNGRTSPLPVGHELHASRRDAHVPDAARLGPHALPRTRVRGLATDALRGPPDPRRGRQLDSPRARTAGRGS
jgi:hypothetical protein